MEVRDQVLMSDHVAERGLRAADDFDHLADLTDFVEADRLVSDLAALVDAGLVVVQEHVFGPARYGLGAGRQ